MLLFDVTDVFCTVRLFKFLLHPLYCCYGTSSTLMPLRLRSFVGFMFFELFIVSKFRLFPIANFGYSLFSRTSDLLFANIIVLQALGIIDLAQQLVIIVPARSHYSALFRSL